MGRPAGRVLAQKGGVAMGLAEVSTILWRERELLELCLFKLEEEQLLLRAERTRWLARATAEVEVVLGEIRRMELARSIAVDTAASELGLAPNPSLAALAEACVEPWASILRDHRTSFSTLTAEIAALAEANRALIGARQAATEAALASLAGLPEAATGTTYTAGGAAATPTVPRARLLNQAL
jgi:hypothetical protein